MNELENVKILNRATENIKNAKSILESIVCECTTLRTCERCELLYKTSKLIDDFEIHLDTNKNKETVIKLENYPETTCFSCPTIFEFIDEYYDKYYFRLRHGYWRLINESTDTELASGSAKHLDLDGSCSWEEAVLLCASEKIFLRL